LCGLRWLRGCHRYGFEATIFSADRGRRDGYHSPVERSHSDWFYRLPQVTCHNLSCWLFFAAHVELPPSGVCTHKHDSQNCVLRLTTSPAQAEVQAASGSSELEWVSFQEVSPLHALCRGQLASCL
jgi:hypothetical protein